MRPPKLLRRGFPVIGGSQKVKNTVQIAGKRVSRVICTYLSLVVGGLVAGTTTHTHTEKKAGRKKEKMIHP
jgi:hypothetical protein